jgi:integrase/recombinase XerC
MVLANHEKDTYLKGNMLLRSYLFHLRARNLSIRTVDASEYFISQFIKQYAPLEASRSDIETYLAEISERCKPSTVWTIWRHLKGFYKWLEAEGDIFENPMTNIPRPQVPPSEVVVLTDIQVLALLKTCRGKSTAERRDFAIITMMLDTGLRLDEVVRLTVNDISQHGTLRVFGKGRKWRTVAMGTTSQTALERWLRIRPQVNESLFTGRRGQLGRTGIRKVLMRRGQQAGFHLHPHMLRHTFVDNWLRNGGAEVDLARLAGWTTTRMAERYAQHRADERAVTAHKSVAPLDSLT